MSVTPAAIRVLHVDDESDFSDVVATYLEREDDRIDVVTAASADEGLERLAERRIDCVVSDFDMPGENGIEFLESVRADHPNLPFVLFTGKGSEEIASRAISAGVTDYLQKETGTDQYTILANRIVNAVSKYRAERAVEHSERRLRTVIDSMPYPVFVTDEDLTYLLSNEAHAEVHGTSVEEIEGATAAETLDDRALEQYRADLRDVFESGEPGAFSEVAIEDGAGRTRYFDSRLIPIERPTADGQAVLGVTDDVTERKRRREELGEKNRQLQAILDTVPAGIFVKKAGGEYALLNETARGWVGVDPDVDATELTDEDVLPEDILGEVREVDRRAFESGETIDVETEIPADGDAERSADGDAERSTDGEPWVVRTRKKPLFDADGEPDEICAVSTDVTDHRRREQRLERYETMVDAMRDGVCLLDADGRFEVVNDALAAFYGASPAELQGRESHLVTHLRDEGPGDPFRELVDGERDALRGECEPESFDCVDCVVDYRLTRATIDGAFDGVVAVARTVSERAERA